MSKEKTVFNDAMMPGERFVATTGEISEQFLRHSEDAYRTEKKQLQGEKANPLSVDLRLDAIHAETKCEIRRLLLEIPDRYMTSSAFAAEDLAFLFITARKLHEKKTRLQELTGGNSNE